MASRKIVHLITSLGGGGTENFLYQLLTKTPSSYKPLVAYMQKDGVIGDRIRALGIEVTHVPSPWQFSQYLALHKPDILHTCLYWANQMGRWVGHLKKVPVIVSSQRAIQVWEKPWHPILDRWTLPYCQGIVANSHAAKQLIEKRLAGRSAKPPIALIPNGLDFARFSAPKDRERTRNNYRIPPDAVVGGTLARLHVEKGAEKIPAFADALLKAHPRLILLVAGAGPLASQLEKQTRHWKDRIRFVGWQENSAEFLAGLDFFWLLSREESFPQALLEASGMSLPWVAPDIGDIRELLQAGAAGLLYPVNDVSAAALRCGTLIQQAAEWSDKAARARPVLEEVYAVDPMAKRFYNFVESVYIL